MKDWTKDFFKEPIFSPGEPEAAAAAGPESAFLWRALRLKKDARLLDLCCGTGRHALRLARRGALVTGVDVTRAYLSQARREGAGLEGLRLVRADMRRLPFRREFDAAYNVWTSFGYFLDPDDDLRALRAAARALKPGGLFLIDVLDFAWLRTHFQAQQWARRADGAYRLEQSELRAGRDPALIVEWTIVPLRGKARKTRFFVRGYDERRLAALLKRAGLKPIRRFHSLDGGRAGRRLILLAKKGARH